LPLNRRDHEEVEDKSNEASQSPEPWRQRETQYQFGRTYSCEEAEKHGGDHEQQPFHSIPRILVVGSMNSNASAAMYPNQPMNAQAAAPGLSSKDHEMYMKNLHDSGYDQKSVRSTTGKMKRE
jgi:hypothetical protein